MSTGQLPEPSPKPATVDDMIGWLGEQALHTGQFGPTTWCPQEICNIASRRCVSGSSRRGSFGHFLAVFRDIWLAQQFPNVELVQDYNFGAGAWIYRLVNKHSQIVSGTPRVKLTDEFDYREMVKQITREGTETPTAIFWHESTIETGDKIVRKQEKAEDKEENEEMGDDGNPYFQPVDWKFLIQDRHRQSQGCSHNRSPSSTRSTDVEVNRAM